MYLCYIAEGGMYHVGYIPCKLWYISCYQGGSQGGMFGLNHWMEGPTAVQYCSDQSLSSWSGSDYMARCNSNADIVDWNWKDSDFRLMVLTELYLLLALDHQSWWQCKFIISSHLLVCLWQFYKLQVRNQRINSRNQRINSRTTDCSPLITNIFPK